MEMVLEDDGSLIHTPTKVRGKPYDRFWIYLSTKLAQDSRFPFQAGAKLRVRIEGEELVISKPGTLSTIQQIQAKIAEKKNGFDDLIIVEHDELTRQIAIACADLLNDILNLLKSPADFKWSK